MGMFYKYDYEFHTDADGCVTYQKVKKLVRHGWEDVEKFISNMSECYDCIQLNEGVLGIGDWILIKFDETCKNANYYVIREWAATCWSSYQTVEPKQFLSAQEQKELEDYYDRLDAEEA